MTTLVPENYTAEEYIRFLGRRIMELDDKLNRDSQHLQILCHKEQIRQLEQKYEKLLSLWADIIRWYTAADRSAHSWVELDKLMENQDKH